MGGRGGLGGVVQARSRGKRDRRTRCKRTWVGGAQRVLQAAGGTVQQFASASGFAALQPDLRQHRIARGDLPSLCIGIICEPCACLAHCATPMLGQTSKVAVQYFRHGDSGRCAIMPAPTESGSPATLAAFALYHVYVDGAQANACRDDLIFASGFQQ